MMFKIIFMACCLVFVVFYLKAPLTFWSRLGLLIGFLVCLAITIPNMSGDDRSIIRMDVLQFTQHIEHLLEKEQFSKAQKNIKEFNRFFSDSSVDPQTRHAFVKDIVDRENIEFPKK